MKGGIRVCVSTREEVYVNKYVSTREGTEVGGSNEEKSSGDDTCEFILHVLCRALHQFPRRVGLEVHVAKPRQSKDMPQAISDSYEMKGSKRMIGQKNEVCRLL